MKNLWIFNHHASLGGHRHFILSDKLSDMGYNVTVISSASKRGSKPKNTKTGSYFVEEFKPGLKYVWLNTFPEYKTNGINRILNMLSYYAISRQYAKKWWSEYGKPDYVIGSSVHPLAWEAAMWVSRKTGAIYFAEVRDLWPLGLMQRFGLPERHPFVIGINLLAKRAYKNSSKIITTMPYAHRYICDELGYLRTKVVWVPNGIDTYKVDEIIKDKKVTIPEELEAFLKNNWCCIYTGSIDSSECVDYMINAAKVIQDRGYANIHFAIIGEGKKKNEYIELAQNLKLNNIKFFPKISYKQVAKAIKMAKVCLAAISDEQLYNYGLSMNKLNDYLYSGIPTVFACNFENIVSEANAGIVVPYGNVENYADAIINLYNKSVDELFLISEKGPAFIRNKYDINKIAFKLLNVLESAI